MTVIDRLRWLLLLVFLLGYAPPSFAQAAAGISGAWTMTFQTDQGNSDADLVLKVDGQKLSGTISSPQGQAPVDGTIVDGKLNFSMSVDACGQSFTMTFTGSVAGESMKGNVDFGGLGAATWTAVRKK